MNQRVWPKELISVRASRLASKARQSAAIAKIFSMPTLRSRATLSLAFHLGAETVRRTQTTSFQADKESHQTKILDAPLRN
jgi:hypothetical protein